MLKDFNFYDSHWFEEGKGIPHLYFTSECKDGVVIFDIATDLMWQQDGSSNSMEYVSAKKMDQRLKQERLCRLP